jgi:mannose-6-phosphate isomerase-like protein (cupin superfamily)
METPQPIDVSEALAALGFLANRTPADDDEVGQDWVATLADYRDGGIFVVHCAGESEWERHPADEVVLVFEGSTTMTLIDSGQKHEHTLGPLQLVVVPENTWHRFVTPNGVKLMTVTPQPSDHQVEHPLEV